MKKILFILAVLIVTALHLRAQNSTSLVPGNITLTPYDVRDTSLYHAQWEAANTYIGRHTVKIFMDTCHIFYHSSENYNSKVSWDAAASKETIIFTIPPKHMILGNTSYTSIFLNGSWYFLMDPQ